MSPALDSSAFRDLLAQAKCGHSEALGKLLDWYAHYLSILASNRLDRRLQARINPSDVVQDAMLAAHRDFAGFRGESQGELVCWLRQILIHTLHASFNRHLKAEKRDIRKEVSIEIQSSHDGFHAERLAVELPQKCQSPSGIVQDRETSTLLAWQLQQLPKHYREVIQYRIFEGLPFDEIAKRIGKSSGATRMLWLRALDALKSNRGEQDDA